MDIELHYIEAGCGEPLILLHGNGEDHTYFEHQISYFSKSYRVIAIDTRGHGQSPRGTAPFTLEQFVEDLKVFMDRQKIEKANILGFSDGGNIALLFALRYMERVKKLILNGANLYSGGLRPHVQMSMVAAYFFYSLLANGNKKARKKAELYRLMVKEPNIKPKELQRLSIPVLVVAGINDMIKQEHTLLIHQNLQNGQISILPGNHFVANQNPKAFNTVVETFLTNS